MRVPRPPARITHWLPIRRSVLDEDLRALVVEVEPDLGEALLRHRRAAQRPVLRAEAAEPTSPGAAELPAKRAVLHRGAVPAVDVLVRHALRALALAEPVLMHDPGVLPRVAPLEHVLRRVPELLRDVQVLEHRRVVLDAARRLVLQHGPGAPGVAGEEHEQVVLEIVQRLRRDAERLHRDGAVLRELHADEPAVRADVLVLLAY